MYSQGIFCGLTKTEFCFPRYRNSAGGTNGRPDERWLMGLCVDSRFTQKGQSNQILKCSLVSSRINQYFLEDRWRFYIKKSFNFVLSWKSKIRVKRSCFYANAYLLCRLFWKLQVASKEFLKTAGLPMNGFLKVVIVGFHDYTVSSGFQKPVHITTSGLDMKDQRISWSFS